jgi:hypothetical protein
MHHAPFGVIFRLFNAKIGENGQECPPLLLFGMILMPTFVGQITAIIR